MLGKRDSLDIKFCAKFKKYFLKMEQFFVALNTISFLSFKQMLDAVTALDNKAINFKVFESSMVYLFFA